MREVKIYNSLSNKIEVFKPLHENKVKIYVCGPTVYNYVHVGNLRPVVVFDVLRRFLLHIGYDVTFISNFTDIDDKIISQAKKENLTEKDIAEKYIASFEDVREKVHALKPTYQPRVTLTMDKIIDFIKDLVEKDYAYVIDGDVYFRVSKIKDYGCLSKIRIDDLDIGARIEESDKKESPLDFALWKKTDEGIKFDSPWGKGRPGWHSECVVMINSLTKDGRIDIHGGGMDLKFPHHENEIAQEEALKGHKIATYWMHNGFINVDNVKMSKSLGNVILAKDYIDEFGGNTARFLLVNTHYRLPVNFSNDLAIQAQKELNKFSTCFRNLAVKLQLNDVSLDEVVLDDKLDIDGFLDALSDDLNTANALSEVYRVIKDSNINLRNKDLDLEIIKRDFYTLKTMFSILGFVFDYPLLTDDDKKIYFEYNEAKERKDFNKSDELRKILISKKVL